jgi:alpha-galactosidase
MGWNSWNTFANDINEDLLKETADALVSTGLKDAGYEYVVIDDCWSLPERGKDGRIVTDPEKFPSGMKALADYIHSKGLKFGMYSCAGTRTCAGYPSSFDHEFVDAKMFADFGVDFLKYDNCNVPHFANSPNLYRRIGLALKASGRDILFSACNWGSDNVGEWIRSTGADMYRSTGDIFDNFQSMSDIAKSQIHNKLAYAGKGCFNDVDMLVVGMHNQGHVADGGMTDEEYQFHFALWCVMQSPLMIGCDVRHMSDATRQTLTNRELIRLNQDPEARPLFQVRGGEIRNDFIGFKHLAGNEFALCFFNFHDSPRILETEFFDFGLPVASGLGLRLTDVMTGADAGVRSDYMRVALGGHRFQIFRGSLVAL